MYAATVVLFALITIGALLLDPFLARKLPAEMKMNAATLMRQLLVRAPDQTGYPLTSPRPSSTPCPSSASPCSSSSTPTCRSTDPRQPPASYPS